MTKRYAQQRNGISALTGYIINFTQSLFGWSRFPHRTSAAYLKTQQTKVIKMP